MTKWDSAHRGALWQSGSLTISGVERAMRTREDYYFHSGSPESLKGKPCPSLKKSRVFS